MLVKFTDYVKKHPIQSLTVVVTLIMAFGFYATQYTYNIDRLVDEYYSGTALIGAGRFSAPLISYFTNWMTFAPFWHTVAMGIILFVSGIALALVLQDASNRKITDVGVFVFGLIFATFPIISYQLTYPILSVLLPYLLIAIAMWLLLPMINGDKARFKNLILATLCLVISVDMYESHAASFLTLFFAVLFLKKWGDPDNKEYTFRYYLITCIKVVAVLGVAIVLDFLISKLVCFAFCGTFDFWYQTNQTVAWFDKSIVDTVKWLIREFIAQYFIAGVANYNIFMFDVAVVAGLVVAVVYSIKRRSAWYAVLYTCVIVASISLGIVLGSAPEYRMAQSLPVFVAFFVMLAMDVLYRKRWTRGLTVAVVAILVMNQTLLINRYSVVEYQRYEFENEILKNIAKDLYAYPCDEKPTVFISDAGTVYGVEFESTPISISNPITSTYKKAMCAFYDAVIPSTTYKRLTARFSSYKSGGYSLSNAEEVADFFNETYKVCPNLFNARACEDNFVPEVYAAFDRIGCSVIMPGIAQDSEKYTALQAACQDMPAYPQEGYIVERDDLIIVKIYGNDQ